MNKYKLDQKAYIECPLTDEVKFVFDNFDNNEISLLSCLIKLQAEIKWETNPKARIEAWCITGE